MKESRQQAESGAPPCCRLTASHKPKRICRKLSDALWGGTLVVAAVWIMLTAAIAQATGTTYYLSPTGLDTNSGLTSNLPWLTPNHAVNCGDVIVAESSSDYSAANFSSGKWGPVTCAAGDNVAWLKCAVFDSCKISVTSGTLDGMRVSASFWGIQGWEVDDTAGGTDGNNCFIAVPPTSTSNIHHIVFANNIANVCPLDGIGFNNNYTASVDYFVAVGNIAYAAGQSSTYCGSGFSGFQPVATDTLPGTHIYFAGNFSYGTVNPAGCYDGNGLIFDSFDGFQTPMPASYSQQAVMDNNMAIGNAGVGVLMEYNDAGAGPTHANLIARHNTAWGNNNDVNEPYRTFNCGEIMFYKALNSQAFLNLASTNQADCYGNASNPAYAFSVANADGSSSVTENVGWSSTGAYDLTTNSPGFSYGTNLFGINPEFSSPSTPEAPSCEAFSSVPTCMGAVIANFTATNTTAASYGYQVPSSTNVSDALFPRWLCNVNLPSGLVTMGCS